MRGYYQTRKPRRAAETTNLDDFLALVCDESWENGYVSAKSAKETGATPTHAQAWLRRGTEPSPTAREHCDAILAWARNTFLVPRQHGAEDWLDNYPSTCATLVLANVTTEFTRGFAASLFAGYERAQADQRERELNPSTSEYIGKIKERLTLMLTVAAVKPGTWGYLHQAVDAAGNIVKWFGGDVYETGSTITLRGTVKDHQVWKGVKETMLNRVKIDQAPANVQAA